MSCLTSRLSCLLVWALLSGCASIGVKPTNPAVVAKMNAINKSSMATVVIYRGSSFAGSALRPTVMLGGKEFVNVGNGVVFVGAFRPGHYAFEMDDKKSGTALDLTPGKSVFLKVEVVPGFWKGGGRLIQMAPEQGKFEASRLQLIPEREIEIPSYR
jgi:hypothetical protein